MFPPSQRGKQDANGSYRCVVCVVCVGKVNTYNSNFFSVGDKHGTHNDIISTSALILM